MPYFTSAVVYSEKTWDEEKSDGICVCLIVFAGMTQFGLKERPSKHEKDSIMSK